MNNNPSKTTPSVNFSSAMLLICALFWGLTFTFTKDALADINVFNFVAWRFLFAILSLIILFPKKIFKIEKQSIKYGIPLGFILTAAHLCQNLGINLSSATNGAFIVNLCIILVPIMMAIINRKLPEIKNIIAVSIATVGLALLTLAPGTAFNLGDLWSLGSAFFFAIYIILVSKYSKQCTDTIQLTMLQLAIVSICTLSIAGFTNNLSAPNSYIVWQALIICSIFATSLVSVIQNTYQRFVPEVQAALIYSAELIFAVVANYFYLHEQITPKILFGGVMIAAGIIISELNLSKTRPLKPALETVN